MIPKDYENRMTEVIDLSWKIFKSQFISSKLKINLEAPFQHHFANIIKAVGDLYCVDRTEIFTTDLETKIANIRNKTKYIDITCGFVKDEIEYNCAIELKFRTNRQSAYDLGRMEVYSDLESLELVENGDYSQSWLFMITDATAYLKKSTRGTGILFALHDGHVIKPGTFEFGGNNSKEAFSIKLEKTYAINWETQMTKDRKEYYFLKC